GYLPDDFSRRKKGNLNEDSTEIKRRITNLAQGKEEYLYEVVRLPKERAIPILKTAYRDRSISAHGRLLLSKALAWFCEKEGNELIEAELKTLFAEEQADGYPDGYVDDYDFIRGREKNVLEGLFWRINQNIGLLAMAGDARPNPAINHIIRNTVSGGGMVERTTDYYNHRIDLKIIPFYNRILNLCFYAERIPDPLFIPAFEKLLEDEHIGGFLTTDYDKVRWRVYGGMLEIS